jgi:branched-subunit amino acid ABC-type transport system permease component
MLGILFTSLGWNINLLASSGLALRLTIKDLLVIVLAVTLMTGLYLFVQRTKLGKAMRATAQNRDAAKMLGIDIDWVITATFLIGGGLAGAAGLMAYITIQPGGSWASVQVCNPLQRRYLAESATSPVEC